MRFFADSYALIEYYKGRKEFQPYFDEHPVLTTRMNLMEIYYAALLEHGLEKAEEYFKSARHFLIEFTEEHLKEACQFRFSNRGKNISYVDALGYVVAKSNNAKFLTGDTAFKGMENVEWVK